MDKEDNYIILHEDVFYNTLKDSCRKVRWNA